MTKFYKRKDPELARVGKQEAKLMGMKPKPAFLADEPPSLLTLLNDDEELPSSKSVKGTPKPPPEPTRIVQLPLAPMAFFNVQTRNAVRITIIDRLGKDWRDLLCYNWDMKVTMHLKTEDLYPSESVREAISYIQKHLRKGET